MRIETQNGACCLRFRCHNLKKKCCHPFPKRRSFLGFEFDMPIECDCFKETK